MAMPGADVVEARHVRYFYEIKLAEAEKEDQVET
jgi:hypothetical protein